MLQVEGYLFREEQADYRMANIVATLLNINRKKGKRPITAAEVLGKKPKRKPIRAKTPDDVLTLMKRIVTAHHGTIKRLDTNE